MTNTSIKRYAAVALFGLGIFASGCKSSSNNKPVVAEQGTLNPNGTFTPNAVQPGQQGTLNPDGTFTPSGSTPNGPTANNAAPNAPQGAVPYGTAPARRPEPRYEPRPEQRPEQRQQAPAPVAVAPPPPAAPVFHTIPVGTPIAVTITETLSASHNSEGDSFTGVLAQPITIDGITAFARGTHVQGTVVAAKGKGRFKGAGDLGIELTSIAGEHVSTSEYEKESKGRGKRTAGFVGGGAGLGALIGGLAGGGKGAAIGALAGAGGGTAASAYTGDRDVVIPSESVVSFTLNSTLRVK